MDTKQLNQSDTDVIIMSENLPDLKGSPGQIAWAENIRKEAIDSGINCNKNETSVKYWIDNRNAVRYWTSYLVYLDTKKYPRSLGVEEMQSFSSTQYNWETNGHEKFQEWYGLAEEFAKKAPMSLWEKEGRTTLQPMWVQEQAQKFDNVDSFIEKLEKCWL